MKLLTVNTGSSSVRLALYSSDGGALFRLAERSYPGASDSDQSLRDFVGAEQIGVVSHRVVHGGVTLSAPCVIDAAVEAEIERLGELAPLHNPRALAWLRACRVLLGAQLKQCAVFDTGF